MRIYRDPPELLGRFATRRAPGMLIGDPDFILKIRYVGQSEDGRSCYEGRILFGEKVVFEFSDLCSGVGGPTVLRGRRFERVGSDSQEAYDEMAESAFVFAAHYADEADDPHGVSEALSDIGHYTDDEGNEVNPWRTRMDGYARR